MTQPRPTLIFAAGKGTRMRHLTVDRPKPLVTVAGRTLLDRTLDHATPDLAQPVVINVHTKPDMIRRAVADRPVQVSDESARLLETGGGLKHARDTLGSDVCFTMNSDAIFAGPNPLSILSRAWRPDMGALLLLVPGSSAAGHAGDGDFDLAGDGRITRGRSAVYTGAQIIDASITDDIAEDVFSMNVAWDLLAGRGRLFGALYDGRWCDVGQPESIPLAEAMIAESADV